MRILYIDDDPDEVLIFCDAIAEIDASIECSGLTDSKQGLDELEFNPAPDIIFLDFNMPGLTGEDCLLKIRSFDHLKNVPVVIYSTGVSHIQEGTLLRIGASMVVRKHNSVQSFKEFFSHTFLKEGYHLR
jgi:CheY-like chemotaxis protein